MASLSDLYTENKLAFWVSLGYVGIGTLAVCSLFPSDTFFGDWVLYASFLTMPVTILSFIYRYGQAYPLYPVFIIQTISFVLTFLVLKQWIGKRKK